MARLSLSRVLRSLVRTAMGPADPPPSDPPPAAADRGTRAGGVRDLAGGLDGVGLVHRPEDDGEPDPGEVVWAWVPYDEGDGRGKDRPVLVVGRHGDDLLGLMLTSKDHDRDAADEARHGRVWVDIGTGDWDRQGRPSEVRVDRVLLMGTDDIRREGAVLDRRRFDRVAAEARRVLGW